MVLTFSDLNETQTYKMPNRVRYALFHEIEKNMSLKNLELFTSNEHTKDYHNRGPSDKTFLFQIGDKKHFYLENLVIFETSDKIVEYSFEEALNDFKFPYAYGEENVYFMLRGKISL